MKELFTQEYKRIVRYIEIFIVIVAVGMIYNFISPASKHKTFYLSGSSTKEIARELEKYGYTVTFIDQIFMHLGTLPKEGWYYVEDTKKSRYAFFSSLHTERKAKLMKIIIYAGETSKELCKRLANDMKLDEKNCLKLMKHVPGLKKGTSLPRVTSSPEVRMNLPRCSTFLTSQIKNWRHSKKSISLINRSFQPYEYS